MDVNMDMDMECGAVRGRVARGAPPAQRALASAPASVGPKLGALVTAASHEARCGLMFKAACTT